VGFTALLQEEMYGKLLNQRFPCFHLAIAFWAASEEDVPAGTKAAA